MTSQFDFELEGKVAVVTGASRGIGEAIARGLAANGCNVVLASRKQEDLDAVADAINGEGVGRAVPIACHTGKPDAIEALFDRVVSELGRLDILVNNAATNPFYGPAVEMPEWAFDKTMEVNVKGYFVMSQAAARLMVEQKSGSIINIASVAALSPAHGQVVYGMTKAAVITMTKGLAKELGPSGIRVNAIAPGLVETKFAGALIEDPEIQKVIKDTTPLGRHGQPEEIVGAALYLASDISSFNTGSVIVCDGGATA
jgi:NAD(P)-dependent dehydrogenase (short-subunit alcohol dehydrogenase family)